MGGAENVEFAEQQPEYPWIRVILGWAGGIGIVWGAGLGLWHAYHWLRHGEPVAYPTTELFANWGMSYPRVTWAGVQKILDWIMAAPAASVLFFGGVALAWLAFGAADSYDDRMRYWRERKSNFELRQREKERERQREARAES